MIIHHGEPCISCEHYSADTSDENHWLCDFDHDTCPHIEELHNAFGYKKQIDAEVLDKIRAEIQKLRNCSCSCSDGIIDDVEDIIDKYKAERSDKK